MGFSQSQMIIGTVCKTRARHTDCSTTLSKLHKHVPSIAARKPKESRGVKGGACLFKPNAQQRRACSDIVQASPVERPKDRLKQAFCAPEKHLDCCSSKALTNVAPWSNTSALRRLPTYGELVLIRSKT